ncbi:MAG: hypothetical protein L0322_21610, partial [Chloroflexi bacterium]|nr:hypothetical protein [Chloroflexota bacterium]
VLKQQQTQLLSLEAEQLVQQAPQKGQIRIVAQVFSDRNPVELRMLAGQVVQNPGTIALFGLAGPASQLIFARSEDAPGEMNQIIKPALQLLGSAAGGGSPSFAQGGGPAADVERVSQALVRAERLLIAQKSGT